MLPFIMHLIRTTACKKHPTLSLPTLNYLTFNIVLALHSVAYWQCDILLFAKRVIINLAHIYVQVYVPQNITVPQNTSFFIPLIKFEGNMLSIYLIFVNIY
jgi:hypothetical protein